MKERGGEEWSLEWQSKELERSRLYDPEQNRLTFSKIRATNLPTCRRITLPKPGCEELEITMRNMKLQMMTKFREFKEKNCDEKGNIKKDNLSKEQREGFKECGEEIKAKEKLFLVTDKSKQFSVDTPSNYVKAMDEHTRGDSKLEPDQLQHLERQINGHSVMYVRFLRMGQDWGHEDRIKSAVTSLEGPIPLLAGMRKDHKHVPPKQQGEGPPTRPVCFASRTVNGPLSHILSKILNKLQTLLTSSSELRAEILKRW